MSTTTDDKKPEGGFMSDMITRIVTRIAAIVHRFAMTLIYKAFVAIMVVLALCVLFALVGGGTFMTAVVFGKIAAVVSFMVAMCILFAAPLRETYDSARNGAHAVFNQPQSA